MNVVTIHQPEHLPWLGFFNKIAKADLFVILDNVQFEKNYFQNRNKIMGTNGVQWINVPTSTKGHMDSKLSQMKISTDGVNRKWKDKYLKTVRMSYGKHPYFSTVFPVLEHAVNLDTEYLCEMNIGIIREFAKRLEIRADFVRASEMELDGTKSDLILDICEKAGADVYIAGPSGRDYLDVERFRDAGITVQYNDYRHPVYEQRKAKEFQSRLAALDLFMNCGWDEGRRVLMEGNEDLSSE